jgi:hypothetical protein
MKSIVSACIILFAPLPVFAQSRFWEKWNKYSASFSYGPSTTYVNMQSKIVVSSSPTIYSFDARLSEEGTSPEEVYKLLVNCSSKSIMDLSQYSSKRWVKATGKYARLIVDACR